MNSIAAVVSVRDKRFLTVLSANIKKKMEIENVTKDRVAKALGITRKTLNDKLRDPSLFKFYELVILFRVLAFTDSEILESVRKE